MPKIRHLKRYRHIARSMVRHGFGHLLTQIGLSPLPFVRHKEEGKTTRLSRAQRFRMLLEDLGPTFVKFGQLLSTRPDLMPRDILNELSRLQDRVSSFPYSDVAAIIEEELGKPVTELFAEVEQTPLAAASVGQVHRARLHSGDQVAVKVRRPKIVQQMQTDLEILLYLARLADRRSAFGGLYSIEEIIQELQRAVENELDFMLEGENAELIRANLNHRSDVLIPRVYRELSSQAVLTMEYVEGTKLTDPGKLRSLGHDPQKITELLVDIMFEQIFRHGVFHADPHPGNLSVCPDGRLVFIDFGITGKLKGERKHQLTSFLFSMVNRNPRQMVRSLSGMGILPERLNRRALRYDMERLMDIYLDIPLHKIHLGRALAEIFSLAHRHRLRVPADFTLLAKTLMTLEGVIENLAADARLMELLQPYAGELIKDRLSFRSLQESVKRNFLELSDIFVTLPRRAYDILERVETEGLPMRLDLSDLRQTFSHLDRITNRITLSIVLLAFSIIMAGLIIGAGLVASATGPSILWHMPIIEAGAIIAGTMAVWLFLAIYRSGKL